MEIHVPQIVHIIAISFLFIKALLQRTSTNFFKCVIFSHHNRNKRYYSIVNVKDFYLLVLKEMYFCISPFFDCIKVFFFYSGEGFVILKYNCYTVR